MKKILLLALVCAGLTFCISARAQVTTASHDKNCTLTVPTGWSVDPMFGLANSPDKKSSVTISNNKSSKTIEDIKNLLPMVYPGATITNISASELWMAGKTPNGMHQLIYHAVKGSTGICIAEFDYDSDAAQAKSVLATLKAK